MTLVGNFGNPNRRSSLPDNLRFGFFGQEIRVNPEVSQAQLIELSANVPDGDDLGDVEAAKLIMSTLRAVIHPDDWDAFWSTAKAENQDIQQDLMPIVQAVVEATTGFPTGQQSDSTPTPSNGGQKYAVEFPSEGLPTLTPSQLREANRLNALQRPDLQAALLQTVESRQT